MTQTIPCVIQRVRVRLSRRGPATQLSHLGQIEVLRRGLQNSTWPVATSQSKRPKVRVGFGPAISVGYESDCELMDVDLHSQLDFKTAKGFLGNVLDEGFSVLDVKSIPRFFPSLEESINVVFYEIDSRFLKGTEERWKAFWDKKSYDVIKKKRDREEVIDARQCVRAWDLSGEGLNLELQFGPKRTLKPERIIQAICNLDDDQVAVAGPTPSMRVCRKKLCFEKQNGDLIEI